MRDLIVCSREELKLLIEQAVAKALETLKPQPLPYLSLHEAAERLHVNERTVRRHIAAGRLQRMKIEGGRSPVLVTRESLDELRARSTR